MNSILKVKVIKAATYQQFGVYINNELKSLQTNLGKHCIKNIHYNTCHIRDNIIHYSCLIEYNEPIPN